MFDSATGQIQFELESIDPQTGLIPFSPLLGFLPPNREGSQGEGFFNYSIFPKSTLTTGSPINAEARIFFDVNDPIDTPEIFHTIDAGAPASSIQPLGPITRSTNFTVSWEAIDDGDGTTGSAPANYDVFVSKNNGPFEAWLIRTSDTAAVFQGVSGESYAFYSVATDNVGIRETKTPSAEATTQVIAGSIWQNPDEPLDVNDDGFVTAIDALLIINYLNSNLPRFLPQSTTQSPPYVDASGDENVSPIDALLVINRLNQQVAAEGESSFARNLLDQVAVNTQVAANTSLRQTSRIENRTSNFDDELLDLLVLEQLNKRSRKGLGISTMTRTELSSVTKR